MKALILAAGAGTRLAPMTKCLPKCLVEVNGTPILLNQIESLHRCGITDITVVSGYLSDVLSTYVIGKYPEITILENEDYAATNNMYSAYLARETMAGEAFLMMNADVFFDASVIRDLLDCPHPNAVTVDVGRYMDESMKVSEREGKLTAISKTIPPEQALGCSIDVYKFSADAAREFFSKCSDYIEAKHDRRLWSEVALHDIFAQVEFHACPLRGRWMEIDNAEDLFAAQTLFAADSGEAR